MHPVATSMKFILIITCAAFWAITGCKTPSALTRKPLIAKDRTYKSERKNTLVAFVGEKIDVTQMPYTRGDFNLGFKAKYKVLELVYGSYAKDTIEFEAYDHYGWPAFASHKYVLLYVTKHKGKYYHEKYQYDDVYKTRDGRWAGPYSEEYFHQYNDSTTIKPEKIDFSEEVHYTIITPYEDHTGYFREPYFKLVGNKAIALYGNYPGDLFKLRRDGVLTARGLFGKPKKETPIKLEDVEIEVPVDDESHKQFGSLLIPWLFSKKHQELRWPSQ